jgi:hypothetical protein
MLRSVACVLFVVLLAATGLTAQEAAEAPEPDSTTNKGEASRQTQQSVCLLLESAARAKRTADRIFRPINLAGKSIQAHYCRPINPKRQARSWNCTVHAGHSSRA